MLKGILHNKPRQVLLKDQSSSNKLTGTIIRNGKIIATLPENCNTRMFNGGDIITVNRNSSSTYPSTYNGGTPKGWDYKVVTTHKSTNHTGDYNASLSYTIPKITNWYTSSYYPNVANITNGKSTTYNGVKVSVGYYYPTRITLTGTCTADIGFKLSNTLNLLPNTRYSLICYGLTNTNNTYAELYIWDYINSTNHNTTIPIKVGGKTKATFTTPSDVSNMSIDMWVQQGNTYNMSFTLCLVCEDIAFNIIDKPYWYLSLSTPNGFSGSIQASYYIDSSSGDITSTTKLHPGDTVRMKYTAPSNDIGRLCKATIGTSSFYPGRSYYSSITLPDTISSVTFTLTELPGTKITYPSITCYNKNTTLKLIDSATDNEVSSGQTIALYSSNCYIGLNYEFAYLFSGDSYGYNQEIMICKQSNRKEILKKGSYDWVSPGSWGYADGLNFQTMLGYGALEYEQDISLGFVFIREGAYTHMFDYTIDYDGQTMDFYTSSYELVTTGSMAFVALRTCQTDVVYALLSLGQSKTFSLDKGSVTVTFKANGSDLRLVYNHSISAGFRAEGLVAAMDQYYQAEQTNAMMVLKE